MSARRGAAHTRAEQERVIAQLSERHASQLAVLNRWLAAEHELDLLHREAAAPEEPD